MYFKDNSLRNDLTRTWRRTRFVLSQCLVLIVRRALLQWQTSVESVVDLNVRVQRTLHEQLVVVARHHVLCVLYKEVCPKGNDRSLFFRIRPLIQYSQSSLEILMFVLLPIALIYWSKLMSPMVPCWEFSKVIQSTCYGNKFLIIIRISTPAKF